MEEDSIPGTLRVYGCASEEMEGVKVLMSRDGLFNDLDGALAFHTAPLPIVGFVRTAAVNYVKVEFFGKKCSCRFSALGRPKRTSRGRVICPWSECDARTRGAHHQDPIHR